MEGKVILLLVPFARLYGIGGGGGAGQVAHGPGGEAAKQFTVGVGGQQFMVWGGASQQLKA